MRWETNLLLHIYYIFLNFRTCYNLDLLTPRYLILHLCCVVRKYNVDTHFALCLYDRLLTSVDMEKLGSSRCWQRAQNSHVNFVRQNSQRFCCWNNHPGAGTRGQREAQQRQGDFKTFRCCASPWQSIIQISSKIQMDECGIFRCDLVQWHTWSRGSVTEAGWLQNPPSSVALPLDKVGFKWKTVEDLDVTKCDGPHR